MYMLIVYVNFMANIFVSTQIKQKLFSKYFSKPKAFRDVTFTMVTVWYSGLFHHN